MLNPKLKSVSKYASEKCKHLCSWSLWYLLQGRKGHCQPQTARTKAPGNLTQKFDKANLNLPCSIYAHNILDIYKIIYAHVSEKNIILLGIFFSLCDRGEWDTYLTVKSMSGKKASIYFTSFKFYDFSERHFYLIKMN